MSVEVSEVRSQKTEVRNLELKPMFIGRVRHTTGFTLVLAFARRLGWGVLVAGLIMVGLSEWVGHPEPDAPDPMPAAAQQMVDRSSSSTVSGINVVWQNSGF